MFRLPETSDKSFGEYVKVFRKENGLRARDLAQLMLKKNNIDWRDDLMLVECIQGRIYRWETLNSSPKPWDLKMLARVMGVTVDFLMVFF